MIFMSLPANFLLLVLRLFCSVLHVTPVLYVFKLANLKLAEVGGSELLRPLNVRGLSGCRGNLTSRSDKKINQNLILHVFMMLSKML